MNYKEAFSSIFKDDKWFSKLLIGIIISLLYYAYFPLIIISGYLVEVAEKVIRKEQGLPEWNNWGQKIRKGLSVFVLIAVLLLPILIPIAIFVPITIAIWIFLIMISLSMPLIIAQYARTGRIREVLRLKKLFSTYKENFSVFIIIALLYLLIAVIDRLLASLGTGLLTPYMSASFVNIVIAASSFAIFPGFIAQIYLHHLYGQAGLAIDEAAPEQIVAEKA